MGGVDIGRRRAANVHASQHGGHGPGLVIEFCTSPGRTGNSTYHLLWSRCTNFHRVAALRSRNNTDVTHTLMMMLRAVSGFWAISRLALGNFRIVKWPSHLETDGSYHDPEIAQKSPNSLCFTQYFRCTSTFDDGSFR